MIVPGNLPPELDILAQAAQSGAQGFIALFVGGTGTGKTMAVEILANYLDLNLILIDLSSIVSKYIGETEKNLKKLFDAAEETGAILYFDEADALFGKRSDVKENHDRYSNIEIRYLMHCMESYHGLAILTTNRVSDIEPEFQELITHILKFPLHNTY